MRYCLLLQYDSGRYLQESKNVMVVNFLAILDLYFCVTTASTACTAAAIIIFLDLQRWRRASSFSLGTKMCRVFIPPDQLCDTSIRRPIEGKFPASSMNFARAFCWDTRSTSFEKPTAPKRQGESNFASSLNCGTGIISQYNSKKH